MKNEKVIEILTTLLFFVIVIIGIIAFIYFNNFRKDSCINKGEKLLAMGTREEICKQMNIKLQTFVVDTDNFLEMPISSRLLYYELGMRADDDGFVDSWKKILLFTGLKEDDMKVLIAKRFVIPFESGVIVIRHWRMNNYLRRDRFNPTHYQKELAELQIDNNNIYNLSTDGKPGGTPLVDTDKIRLDENRIEYNIL